MRVSYAKWASHLGCCIWLNLTERFGKSEVPLLQTACSCCQRCSRPAGSRQLPWPGGINSCRALWSSVGLHQYTLRERGWKLENQHCLVLLEFFVWESLQAHPDYCIWLSVVGHFVKLSFSKRAGWPVGFGAIRIVKECLEVSQLINNYYYLEHWGMLSVNRWSSVQLRARSHIGKSCNWGRVS